MITISPTYNLMCDDCGKIIDGSTRSAAHVREVAKKEGTARRIKGRDVCFKCSAPTTDRKEG